MYLIKDLEHEYIYTLLQYAVEITDDMIEYIWEAYVQVGPTEYKLFSLDIGI